MRHFSKIISLHKWVLLLLVLAIFVRFYNFQEFLFFTADNGRDNQQIQAIVQGNLTLIGPTSGLQGFYLGPFWYYLGVPGYLLTQGNPYGIALWLIALASLAVPLFFLIGKLLFPRQPNWALITFLLLAFVPGSIWGSIFVLSPMMTLPLMAGALLAFWRARHSRWWLFVGFFLLGLVLQTEFAYGVFILPIIYILIAWIRQRFSIWDYGLGFSAVLITLMPQIAFELRHQFLMTKFLLQGLTTTTDTQVGWLGFWDQRIQQLFGSMNALLLGNTKGVVFFGFILLFCLIIALRHIWRNRSFLQSSVEKIYRWQLLSIFAVVPYVGFLLWRGNHGNFFGYYLTPHFIFLVPLVVLGIQQLPEVLSQLLRRTTRKINQEKLRIVQVILVTVWLSIAWLNYSSTAVFIENTVGMKTIETAISTALSWQQADTRLVTAQNSTFSHSLLTFTPNYLTAQYDYMTEWQTKKQGLAMPYTQVFPEQEVVYTILEPDYEFPEVRFIPWYARITEGRILVRWAKVGVLTLETWMKPDFAEQYGFSEYQPSLKENLGW